MTGTLLDFMVDADWDTPGTDPEASSGKLGVPADHARGIQYVAPWETAADGFSEHSRRSVRALANTGAVVQLRGLRHEPEIEDEVQARMYDLLTTSVTKCVVRVIQVVPIDGQLGKWVTHPKLSAQALAGRNRATAFYTVWEREGVSPKIVKLLSRAGQVWVGCERSRKMLVEAGVPERKLHRVPMPFAPDDPHLKLVGRTRQPGAPRLLHVGKWEPRKGQQNIIGAFMLAFRPGDAELMLKTSKYAPKFAGYPKGPGEACALWLDDERVRRNGWTAENVHPSIRMIRERLTEAQMVALHGWSDIYVTLSHGEGFDMPAFDAKLAGNRMVYTESGGPEDFAGSGDVLVPTAGSVPCHPFYQWEGNARGTGYWLEDAAEALREATVGLNTREFKHDFDVDAFSEKHVGREMLANLNELAESFGEEPLG